MEYQHKNLAQGKWEKLSFWEQMANIGSEVERTISWKEKGNQEYSRMAFERALELIELTVDDPKNKKGGRLKELLRTREAMIDHFCFDNEYKTTDEIWRNYFFAFNYACQLNK